MSGELSTGQGRLTGKLALVTGADRGIGRGIALELAAQGADVVLHTPPAPADIGETVRRIRAAGRRAQAVSGDFSRVEDCRRVVDGAGDFLGGLDILVNNAGVTAKVPLDDVTPAQFDRIFHINVRGAFFCAQRAVRWMAERGGGAIVNIASIHAHGGVPGHAVYAATKGAIVSLTRELAIELIPRQIRVNAVAPGHTEVERHRADPDYTPAVGAAMVPWGRAGRPADVAKAVVYLASDEAEMVTGQVLYVDGGTTAKLALDKPHLSQE